jgi:hypothetical protein
MHLRRVEALAPLLRELNPAVFLNTHKEVALEVAGAFQEVFEFRLQLAEDRIASAVGGRGVALKAAEAAGINEAADGALRSFAHFVRCFDEKRAAPPAALLHLMQTSGGADGSETDGDGGASRKPLSGASAVDEGSAEAYMTALFCSARILARRLAPAREQRLRDQRGALALYRFVLEAAPRLAPAGAAHFFESELGICREMAQLMPQKLAIIEKGGADVLAPGAR